MRKGNRKIAPVSGSGRCQVDDLLKSGGLKKTRQREAILNAILDRERPFTVGELREGMKSRFDLVTMYRVLEQFQDRGLVRRVAGKSGGKTYEHSCARHPVHPHFTCERCRRIICLDALKGHDTARLREYAREHSVQDVSVSLSGLCGRCRSK